MDCTVGVPHHRVWRRHETSKYRVSGETSSTDDLPRVRSSRICPVHGPHTTAFKVENLRPGAVDGRSRSATRVAMTIFGHTYDLTHVVHCTDGGVRAPQSRQCCHYAWIRHKREALVTRAVPTEVFVVRFFGRDFGRANDLAAVVDAARRTVGGLVVPVCRYQSLFPNTGRSRAACRRRQCPHP